MPSSGTAGSTGGPELVERETAHRKWQVMYSIRYSFASLPVESLQVRPRNWWATDRRGQSAPLVGRVDHIAGRRVLARATSRHVAATVVPDAAAMTIMGHRLALAIDNRGALTGLGRFSAAVETKSAAAPVRRTDIERRVANPANLCGQRTRAAPRPDVRRTSGKCSRCPPAG
jgi:hypothetical protein